MARPRILLAAASCVFIATAGVEAKIEAQRPLTLSLAMASLSGRDLFQFYCAGCHGRDGKGDGPVAASLRRRPPDLTTIASRHDGEFRTEEIVRFVSGDTPSPAHGTREMPVWGPIFMSFEPRDRLTRIRIENVVAYIESLQAR